MKKRPQKSTQKNEIEEIYINNCLFYEEAKLKELESFKDNNVYETVENQNQECISLRWVSSIKQTDKGSKPKAHLVARGFEEDSLNTFEKESPTASKDTLKHCYQPLLPITGISSQQT